MQKIYQSMAALQASKKTPSLPVAARFPYRRGSVGGTARQENQGIRQRPLVLPVRSPLTDGATPLYNQTRIIVN